MSCFFLFFWTVFSFVYGWVNNLRKYTFLCLRSILRFFMKILVFNECFVRNTTLLFVCLMETDLNGKLRAPFIPWILSSLSHLLTEYALWCTLHQFALSLSQCRVEKCWQERKSISSQWFRVMERVFCIREVPLLTNFSVYFSSVLARVYFPRSYAHAHALSLSVTWQGGLFLLFCWHRSFASNISSSLWLGCVRPVLSGNYAARAPKERGVCSWLNDCQTLEGCQSFRSLSYFYYITIVRMNIDIQPRERKRA